MHPLRCWDGIPWLSLQERSIEFGSLIVDRVTTSIHCNVCENSDKKKLDDVMSASPNSHLAPCGIHLHDVVALNCPHSRVLEMVVSYFPSFIFLRVR